MFLKYHICLYKQLSIFHPLNKIQVKIIYLLCNAVSKAVLYTPLLWLLFWISHVLAILNLVTVLRPNATKEKESWILLNMGFLQQTA